jgi:Ca2+-binding EF-hand superfamily protein
VGISDAEVQSMLDEADTNKDGHIDFKEFLVLMSKRVEAIRGIGKKLLEKATSIRHVFKARLLSP